MVAQRVSNLNHRRIVPGDLVRLKGWVALETLNKHEELFGNGHHVPPSSQRGHVFIEKNDVAIVLASCNVQTTNFLCIMLLHGVGWIPETTVQHVDADEEKC